VAKGLVNVVLDLAQGSKGDETTKGLVRVVRDLPKGSKVVG
jgi:hypothetical protein